MAEFHKLLITNRGEIAMRILRSARDIGLRTVAVYSDADADAPHVAAADEAVLIGPAPVGESYLNAENLLDAARRSGADALHPGYGFLSENADFARACATAGLTFVGPPPEAIALMGSKRLAKAAMQSAGVPVVPGYQGADQTDDRLVAEAERIGFPLMVKASAGGGGRGMRLVRAAADLPDALVSARSEARMGFGDDALILERALIDARHIEIQIFADAHGNVVHLGERDCSVQRRHQKVIEEAPSPFVDPDLRATMGAAAITAARACDYRGAGTVEFLVEGNGRFHFLEMNTRLQVEHPVTEMITGQDLVAWQLRVAAGDPLPLTQAEVSLDGWAIEARLYAEDPERDFLPQTGPVALWQAPGGRGIRVDHGIRTGQGIGSHYDPMLAKIIAHGPNREVARQRLLRALDQTVLLGLRSNRRFLSQVLRHSEFADGRATTGFLDRALPPTSGDSDATARFHTLALAAVLFHMRPHGVPPALINWSNALPTPRRVVLDRDDTPVEITLSARPDGVFHLRAGADTCDMTLVSQGAGNCEIMLDGLRQTRHFAFWRDQLFVDGPGGDGGFRDATLAPAQGSDSQGDGTITAPLDGTVVAVHAAPGAPVTRGQLLLVLDAMKMEHRLCADIDGVLDTLSVRVGDQLRSRQVLGRIAPHEPIGER